MKKKIIEKIIYMYQIIQKKKKFYKSSFNYYDNKNKICNIFFKKYEKDNFTYTEYNII